MNRSVLAMELEDVASGWTGSSRPGLDRAFRAAVQHSRVVRLLRIAVPVLIVVGIVAVSLASWFSPTWRAA